MVLICWEHHDIPHIAEAFGPHYAPKKWHGEVFDEVWILTFQKQGTVDFKKAYQGIKTS